MQTPPVTTAPEVVQTALGTPTASAMIFFFLIVLLTLVITWWAARRTKSTREYYAAGRSVTGLQNGLALAGDYMSAASFLGIAGLVATKGYDGMIYATGWLVGWPALLFLVAEPLRNLGKYTFADVVAFRLRQGPVRIAAAIGGRSRCQRPKLLIQEIRQAISLLRVLTRLRWFRQSEWPGQGRVWRCASSLPSRWSSHWNGRRALSSLCCSVFSSPTL